MSNGWRKSKKVNKWLVGFIILMVVSSLGLGSSLNTSYAETISPDDEFRISGNNRYQTAYEIAIRSYDNPDTVIIVRGDSIGGVPQVVDGLTASGLSGVKKAPILLTGKNHLHNDTKEGIIALSPKNAIIVGGTAAISDVVKDELTELGLSVERIQGENRFKTAAQVAIEMGSSKDRTAIIVDGYSDVDSLVAGPLAHQGYPILLVDNQRGSIPEATMDALQQLNIEKLWIVGGTDAVSGSIEAGLNALKGITVTKRFDGADRIETSLSVAKHEGFEDIPGMSLINGWNYVDAVAASTLGKPVVYFREERGLTSETREMIKTKGSFAGIGGPSVVPESIIEAGVEVLFPGHFSSNRRISYTRHNEAFSAVLNRQSGNSDLKLWKSSGWTTPSAKEIEFYLDSGNFYDENRLPDFYPTERVKISVGTLNFRSSPEVRSDNLIGSVSRGEIYEVYEELRGWFKISVDDETGWIHGDYVHRKSQTEEISRRSAEVTTSGLNVRMGPSTAYERIGSITLGERYTLLEELNGWYQIQYFDKQGWISGSFAKIVEDLQREKMQFFTLDSVQGVSGSELNTVLSGQGALGGLGPVFRDAARENQLNELYLVSHALAEKEGPLKALVEGVQVKEMNGKSVPPMVVYNVFGIEGRGSDPLKAASEFAYEQGWNTIEKSIKEGAKWISKEFIHHPEGTQNTLYKMAWDPSNRNLNSFSSDIGWASRQGEKLYHVYQELNRTATGFDLSTYQRRVWPVPGYYRISSHYGYRIHPIDGDYRKHIGMDVPAPEGHRILAVMDGVVTRSAYNKDGYGYWVEINHGNGITTRYAHNSKNLVTVDQLVKKGEKIAEIGTTGSSTGNHLHFEVRRNGFTIDPFPWLKRN